MTRILLALTTALLTTGALATDDNQPASFARDIAPLLKQRCAVCHITGQEPGLMSLVPAKAYANLVGPISVQSKLQRVEPGKPEQSYLYHKLTGSHLEAGGEGLQMPFAAPPLPQTQLDLIRRWIEEGALDN